LLLSPGASRLAGLGMALVAIAGYQTSSPVALGVSLCGLVCLATGTLRIGAADPSEGGWGPLSATGWRALLGAVAAGIADPPGSAADPVLIEVVSGGGGDTDGTDGTDDVDTASVRAPRRGRPIALKIRRAQGVVREVDVTVGVPGETPPDATIESHETWLGRRPDDRAPAPRTKTGDPSFDRKIGVYGHAPLQDRALRRKILRLPDGTITLWAGHAARFVAPGDPTANPGRLALPAGPASARLLVELVDTLVDLVEAADVPSPAPPATAG